MRKTLELIYKDSKVHEINTCYIGIFFEDAEGNKYTWWVTANTKAWTDKFKFGKGDRVLLTGSVHPCKGKEKEFIIKNVRILN